MPADALEHQALLDPLSCGTLRSSSPVPATTAQQAPNSPQSRATSRALEAHSRLLTVLHEQHKHSAAHKPSPMLPATQPLMTYLQCIHRRHAAQDNHPAAAQKACLRASCQTQQSLQHHITGNTQHIFLTSADRAAHIYTVQLVISSGVLAPGIHMPCAMGVRLRMPSTHPLNNNCPAASQGQPNHV